jgi:hypothetical protein
MFCDSAHSDVSCDNNLKLAVSTSVIPFQTNFYDRFATLYIGYITIHLKHHRLMNQQTKKNIIYNFEY